MNNLDNGTGKFVVFNGAGIPLKTENRDLPDLEPGEILVKNLYTTLCGSDLHTFTGQRKEILPTVLGHEIVGEIIEIDETHDGFDLNNKKLKRGDKITWTIFSSDPKSLLSKEGIPQKGKNLFKYGHAKITNNSCFHGGLAEYCVLRENTGIVKLSDNLPLPISATLNCAVSTVAGAIRMAGNLVGKNILLFGVGMLGISAIPICKENGANWIGVVDVSLDRLNRAKEFGADEIFESKELQTNFLKLKRRFQKGGVDIVFDFSGVPNAMELGMEILGIGGVAVWIGAVFKNRKLEIDAEKVIRSVQTIRGLHNYNYDDFVDAVNFMENFHSKYPFNSLIEKEFDFNQVDEAFNYAIKNRPFRVGIRI